MLEDDPNQLNEDDELFDAATSSLPPEFIAALKQLDIDPDRLVAVRNELIDGERAAIRRPIDEVYAEYRLQIASITLDLERVSRAAMYPVEGRKADLRVAMDALKARASILDKTIARGQDLGIFPTATKQTKVQVGGGLMFGIMSTEELVDHMKKLSEEGKRLSERYDAVPFTALPEPDIYGETPLLDVDPEFVPATEPVKQTAAAKPRRVKT